MGLESGSGIWSLNTSNPASDDDINQGDDHIRLIKASVKQTFPAVSATVNVSHSELNHLSGAASNIQNQLDTQSASLQTVISAVTTVEESVSAAIARIDVLSASLAQVIADVGGGSLTAAYGQMWTFSLNQVVSSGGNSVVRFLTPSFLKNVTANTATGTFLISKPGHYMASFSSDFSCSASNILALQVMVDDQTATGILGRAVHIADQPVHLSLQGIVSATSGKTIGIRVKSENVATDAVSFINSVWLVNRIGDGT